MAKIIYHPEYSLATLAKHRLTIGGGTPFLDNYLQRYTLRETYEEFLLRKKMSYCAAQSKAAIIEIKNSIYQRMPDIDRVGGAKTYQAACAGQQGGVNNQNDTMNSFIGNEVVLELLAMGKVGVFIDSPIIPKDLSKSESADIHPYLYVYKAEDIINWSFDNMGQLSAVLLRSGQYNLDPESGLPTESKSIFRLLKKVNGDVTLTYKNDKGEELETHFLELSTIPFVIFSIGKSLLEDIADYQIALTNLASADMHYALKANFPFYTEQYNPQSELSELMKHTVDADGNVVETKQSASVELGVTQGRRYPKGLERPDFIHPSSEPFKASMEKQTYLKEEIRQLVHTSLANLASGNTRESGLSKLYDEIPLEAGLAFIGTRLENGERAIADIWSEYDTSGNKATIIYPKTYTLKTDKDRQEEVNRLLGILEKTPSPTFKKLVLNQIVSLIAPTLDQETLNTIAKEIGNLETIVTDSENLKLDHEAGFVSTQLASKLRGYPEGEVEQAKKDHAERAARIALAQSKVAARGVSDLDSNPDESGKDEKKTSQNPDNDPNGKRKVRGTE